MSDKVLTCATLIYSKETNRFLVCHVTETKHWSLPKGIYDVEDDHPINAAIREVQEETGYEILDVWNMAYVGTYLYLAAKDMSLYFYQIENELPISKMKCSTTFTSKYSSKPKPEVDNYKWIEFSQFKDHLNVKQFQLLNSLESEIFSYVKD